MSAVGNVARVLAPLHSGAQPAVGDRSRGTAWLPKSSTSRLLKSMANAGLLANADRSSGYGVGNLIFETSRRHRVHSTLSVVADEELARIARGTGHTGYIAIRDGTDMLGLRMRPAASRCGGDLARRPAAGLLLVERPRPAGAPRRRCREGVARRAGCSRRRPTHRRRPTIFRRAGGGAREGLGAGDRRGLPGVESLAVCVQDRESGESVAICISYSAAMISANEKSRIVTLLMRAGCELG